MKFETLNLDPKILDAITSMGYERCTPVQEQTFPESLIGNDVAVQAQTGTGKTAVFLVTALQRMVAANDAGGTLRVLVLVPTRELAVQVEQQAVQLCKNLHYRSIAIYGGVGYDEQERALSSGAEIIVATPGRLIDFLKSRKVDMGTLGFFIIDEADRMFDMGFMEDVKYILKFAPPKDKRQTIIVSATLDDRIRHLAYSYMQNPVEIEIEPDQITVEKVDQKLFHVSREEKFPLLLTLLKREEMKCAIIFTNMKRTAEELGFRLGANGVQAEVLTGDIDQKKRLKIINRAKEGALNILVATDVAARGIHIDDVSHVINYDLPADAANYVHRIGRTARAGASGTAYTLACEDLVINLPPIERYIEQKIAVANIDFDLAIDEGGEYRRARRGRPGERGGRPHDRDRDRGPRREGRHEPRPQGKRFEERRPPRGPKAQDGYQRPPRESVPKPSSQMSAEDRMELYRRKYGDSFGGKAAEPRPAEEGRPRQEHRSAPRHEGQRGERPGEFRNEGGGRKHKPRGRGHGKPGAPQREHGQKPHAPHHAAPKPHGAHHAKPHAEKPKHEEKPKKGGILKKIFSVFKKKK
ncbi:MAG: DEAD/DEAH box helicase [Nitrospinae bacterium]|nr:DEAD/DEAH box helicase [Nitrospinota bacterium]